MEQIEKKAIANLTRKLNRTKKFHRIAEKNSSSWKLRYRSTRGEYLSLIERLRGVLTPDQWQQIFGKPRSACTAPDPTEEEMN